MHSQGFTLGGHRGQPLTHSHGGVGGLSLGLQQLPGPQDGLLLTPRPPGRPGAGGLAARRSNRKTADELNVRRQRAGENEGNLKYILGGFGRRSNNLVHDSCLHGMENNEQQLLKRTEGNMYPHIQGKDQGL